MIRRYMQGRPRAGTIHHAARRAEAVERAVDAQVANLEQRQKARRKKGRRA